MEDIENNFTTKSNSKDADTGNRIRPNSQFLSRFIDQIERANFKLSQTGNDNISKDDSNQLSCKF
jgi:hypothetical protein